MNPVHMLNLTVSMRTLSVKRPSIGREPTVDSTTPMGERQATWAPARGEQGGQAPTLEKIRMGMAHPGNFSHGLKTSWQ